jgi:hypothetical protein
MPSYCDAKMPETPDNELTDLMGVENQESLKFDSSADQLAGTAAHVSDIEVGS